MERFYIFHAKGDTTATAVSSSYIVELKEIQNNETALVLTNGTRYVLELPFETVIREINEIDG